MSGSRSNARAIDPAIRQVAAVYAKALVGAAEKTGQAESIVGELEDVVEQVLGPFPKFNDLLVSRLVATEDKQAAVDRVLGGRLSPTAIHFLKVLLRHERFECLAAAVQLAREQIDQMRGRMRVHVTTAEPLSDGVASQLKESLRAMLGGEPILTPEVDPGVIGGVVLRVGDTVYDGSVATQLGRVRSRMINRSVHEIQSRRDRFGNPAGN